MTEQALSRFGVQGSTRSQFRRKRVGAGLGGTEIKKSAVDSRQFKNLAREGIESKGVNGVSGRRFQDVARKGWEVRRWQSMCQVCVVNLENPYVPAKAGVLGSLGAPHLQLPKRRSVKAHPTSLHAQADASATCSPI